MGLYDNVGAIGGNNYVSLMNDPYFLAALQSYNPNFKSSQTANITQQYADNSTITTPASNNAGIPVNYATTEPDNSNTGLWVTGAIGAAALIGLGAKGGGNPLKGAKALYEKFFKSGSSKVSDMLSQKLNNIRILRNGDKVECLVPGETTKITKHKDAISHLEQYFGSSASKDIFNVTKGKSILNGGTFVFETGDVVTFEGGKITKIVNKKGKDITKLFFEKGVTLEGDNKTFIDNLNAFINNAKEMKQGWTKGFRSADITRELGDNTARITYGGKTKPVIQELTTLKPVEATDDAVKAWAYDHPEAKVLLEDATFKNYKAPKGMKVGEAQITSNGIVYHFKNGEIVGITNKDGYFAKGKKECNIVLVEKEQDIKAAYEQLFSGNIEKKYRKMIDMKNVKVNYVRA